MTGKKRKDLILGTAIALIGIAVLIGGTWLDVSNSIRKDDARKANQTQMQEVKVKVDALDVQVKDLAKRLEEQKQQREAQEVSRGSVDRSRTYKLRVESTAYTTAADEGSGTGLAADGNPAIANHTFAVDPNVIPLGSKVHVPGIGWGVAHDTGGAIKGHILDVCVGTKSEAYQWGRRTIDIEVVPPGA